MYKTYLYIIFLLLALGGYSQEHEVTSSDVLLKREIVGGLHFNAHGSTAWGIASEYNFQKNYKYKHSVGVLLSNLRHPKEYKIYAFSGSTKGYYYGKLNSLVSLRLMAGGKLILFQAKRENGIEVTWKYAIGPSIALQKPVYLKIEKTSSIPLDERYNPEYHNYGNIAARSSWFKGLGEGTIRTGIFFKTGFDFNFSPIKSSISGGEFGFIADYFPGKEIPMMYNNENNNLFTSLYLQFNIGQKIY